MPPETVDGARAVLFVPGDRPDRFAKAAAAGADAIILDLEDAVRSEAKDAARCHVASYLREGHPAIVRINASGTPWHDDDVAMVGQYSCAVMVPKSDAPDVLAELAQRIPDAPLLPLLESATALLAAQELCRVSGVRRAAFGNVDLATELGIDPTDRQALLTARSTLVLAAASAETAPPLDGVTTAIHDTETLLADSHHAAGLGFTGKLCIHPQQLPTVRSAFTPSPDLVRWARDVIAAAEDGSATVVDGRMVDKPVVDRARSVLDRADPAGQLGS